jgi:hypothetical protein
MDDLIKIQTAWERYLAAIIALRAAEQALLQALDKQDLP